MLNFSSRTRFRLILSSLVLFLILCTHDSHYEAIDSDLLGYLSEGLGQNRYLHLYLETEKEYPHCNNEIHAEITPNQQTINVDFTGIYKPDIFLPAFGPATGEWNLGNLTCNISLYFKNHCKCDKYNLNITNQKITISEVKSDFVKLDTETVYRIPENFIWCYLVYYTTPESLQYVIRENFFSELRTIGARDTILQSGIYRHIIDGHRDWFRMYNSSMGYPNGTLLYGFSYNGDTLQLQQLLHQYHETYENTIYIWITTWQGRRFYMHYY